MSAGPVIILESAGVADTQRIGEQLGRALNPGDVIGLIGPLGAGKTALVQGIAVGAGVPDRREVNSPTFVIVNEYETKGGGPGGLRIFHIDAYRLRGGEDLAALGFEEMIERGAVIIEWADKVIDWMPGDAVVIEIEPTGPTGRRLTSHASASGGFLVAAMREAQRELEDPARPG